MENFNHKGGNGNEWVGGWQHFILFSSAIQMADVNSSIFEVENNMKKLMSL
jgi:hypothetical protein